MSNLTGKNQAATKPGLIIAYFGNSVAVEAADGQVFQCQLHRNQALPVVGDRVRFELGGGDAAMGVVTQIEPRTSLLARGDPHGKRKPIAANIDVMLVVMAPPPIFAEHLIDRYLVAAELLGIQPLLVLNKMDLLSGERQEAALARLNRYQSIPCEVALSSASTVGGVAALAALLRERTAVLVGPSGVGKSSIIAALGCVEPIRVGVVSPKGAGKHTTTATRLYHLPQGGNVIDSPGVRDFSLWHVNKEEVLRGFKEFQPYVTNCRFRDCQHRQEPGCQVQAAVADGKISPTRFESYLELMHDVSRIKKQY